MKRLFLLGACFALACSVLIEPGDDLCASDDGCPVGQVCNAENRCEVSGVCTPGAAEVCNGRDDDCDEAIDEGFEMIPEVCNTEDDDCDGSTDEGLQDAVEVCNGLDDNCDGMTDNGVPSGPDICNEIDDDCDMTIDEGTAETCNNFDDDCDGSIDEMPETLCNGTLKCLGSCLEPTCANDPDLRCPDTQFCDDLAAPPLCTDRPPSTCTMDSECEADMVCFDEAGICRDETPFGTPCTGDSTCRERTHCEDLSHVGLSGFTCTTTCCDDNDCDAGAVCVDDQLGVRLCVPRDAASGEEVGGSCDSWRDCSSGYCDFGGDCDLSCGNEASCTVGSEVCRFVARSGRVFSACETPRGSGETGESCSFDFECQSDFCVGGRCASACNSEVDCEGHCAVVRFIGIVEDSVGKFCSRGGRDPGAPCDDDCGTGLCGPDGLCAPLCCNNDDCAPGFDCQPTPAGDFFPTICVEQD